jgi:hypothetical protein
VLVAPSDDLDDEEALGLALSLAVEWPNAVGAAGHSGLTYLDVDRFREFALVTGAGYDEDHDSWVYQALFHMQQGQWVFGSGGGSGGDGDPLTERFEAETWDRTRPQRRVPEELRARYEWGGESFRKPAESISHVRYAQVLCAPHVASVTVERDGETRTAHIGSGPGWLGVVWLGAMQPLLTAYDDTGQVRTVARLGEPDPHFDRMIQHLRGPSQTGATSAEGGRRVSQAVGVAMRFASVSLDDDSAVVLLPAAVVEETFHRGLWATLNGRFGLSIDEYQGQEIPVTVVAPCADFIREHLAAETTLEPEAEQVLRRVADLLDEGAKRGVSAWVSL